MDRKELLDLFDLPLTAGEAQARGAKIEHDYVACANGFRQIAECTSSGDGEAYIMPDINLGPDSLGNGRVVDLWARLYVTGDDQFFVATRFFAGGDEVDARATEKIFGSIDVSFHPGMPIPEFVLKPGTTSPYDWDPAMYQYYAEQLEPMIADAESTLAMLIEALRDDTLNPHFAERARELFPDKQGG